MDTFKKVLLVILDGWGIGTKPEADAIAQAKTPFVDSLLRQYPNSRLITFGEEVGLPDGQMGNSEVGHLNIGAGRIVYQELARINKAIQEKTLHENTQLLAAFHEAHRKNKAIHLMGLISDGGVHSHINHLKALIDIAETYGGNQIYVHAFTDGRDVDPKSGVHFISELENYIANKSTQLASVIGRYFAMDRDQRWERIKQAYDLIVHGKGIKTNNLLTSVSNQYDAGVTDEFLPAIVKTNGSGHPIATLKDGDILLCFNFRTDRPRQISRALTQEAFPDFDMRPLGIRYLTMTKYDEDFTGISVLFEKENLQNTIGEILSRANKKQVRIAETEKYPHVTFFFSGGREAEFDGERRILIPSPKVATYDLQPQMSAPELTQAIVEDIHTNGANFICLNYANTDMVGHTGDFEAAMKAAETVDNCLNQLLTTALEHEYVALIIADHGNSDYMINDDGSPNTAHTKNLVPCIFVSNTLTDQYELVDGRLADIAPTILSLMDIAIPTEMNGANLLKKKQ